MIKTSQVYQVLPQSGLQKDFLNNPGMNHLSPNGMQYPRDAGGFLRTYRTDNGKSDRIGPKIPSYTAVKMNRHLDQMCG
jgi:hypothetical protein